MEKHSILTKYLSKSKEKSETRHEIFVTKRKDLINSSSIPTTFAQQTNYLRNKRSEKNDKQIISNHKIKFPSELLSRTKTIDSNLNTKKPINKSLMESKYEIKHKNISIMKNNDEKEKILGKIVTGFSSNKKINNNIFDDGNQITFHSRENQRYFNNNLINNDITTYNHKDNESREKIYKIKKNNNIKDINTKNINNTNNNEKLMKSSTSSSRHDFFKRRPFNYVETDKSDKIKKEEEIPFNNNYKIGKRESYTNNFTSSNKNLETENILESLRKRNKGSKFSKINQWSYKNININNKSVEENNEGNNEGKNNNQINNINNINNNISLNNRYNFYIKIGKNSNIDINKDNKDINYEIKLSNPTHPDKGSISQQVIDKLIVEYDIDKLNKNIDSNENKKGINVNIKPLFKKIEIQKILVSNDNDEEDKNKGIKEKSSKNKVNAKSFKFLLHQAHNNRELTSSFNRFYENGKSLKGRSISINDRIKNNDSFSSNLVNEGATIESNKPINYNSEKKSFDERNHSKKYKNFYSSYKNIAKNKKHKNISYENNPYKKEKNNKNNIKTEFINMDNVNINNNHNDYLELTPTLISVSNTNEESLNKKINNNDNMAKTNNNINVNSNILNSIREKNNKNNKVNRIINSMEGVQNQLNTPKRRRFSKVNTSFETTNSNINSANSVAYSINNINSINKDNATSSLISNNFPISFINLEILYVLEEKLKIIIEKINSHQRYSKECYDFINYYFLHNFYNEKLRLFQSGPNRKKVNDYIKIELLCYFLCYDISDSEDFSKTEIIIKSIFSLLHKNFLIFLSLVITNYKYKDNNIIILLNKIVKDHLSNDFNEKNTDFNNLNENKYIQFIDNNSKKLIDYYIMIIENIYMRNLIGKNKYIKFPDCINFINPNSLNGNKLDILIANFFTQASQSIIEYNYDLYKKFFYLFLYFKQSSRKNQENKIESQKTITNKNAISENNNHFLLPKIKNNKYTLVVDLDETLIYSQKTYYYKYKNSNINIPKTNLILRPGLNEFLHDMKSLFELVIFSSGTPDYVDPIVKMIEKNEKYFDYILYRQHITVDEEGDNIKNLNIIGRDLKNVIIIDDIAKYFKLQKENGICIKPFYGNIISDRKTLKTLDDVLQKIRADVEESKDIRISLEKYRDLLSPIINNTN